MFTALSGVAFALEETEEYFVPIEEDVVEEYVEKEAVEEVILEDCCIDCVQAPIEKSESEYFVDIEYGNDRSTSNFDYVRIRYSGKSPENSIVVILLADGFDQNQFGTWPGPADGTALWHANAVIDHMLDTRPFDLFADYFTVYMVHAVRENQEPGANGYLRTVRTDGTFVLMSYANENRINIPIHTAANSVEHTRGHQNMVHLFMSLVIVLVLL